MQPKLLVASALTHPLVGSTLAVLFRNHIPGAGGRFDTSASAIDARSKAALFWGFYEKAERGFITSYLRPDLDVIELGASMGVVTCAIARRLEPGRRVVAVEANPRMMPALRENVVRNGAGPTVTVVHGAISYEGGETVELEVGNRSIAGRLAAGDAGQTATVPRLTLSDLIREHRVGDFALVTDIEGAEVGLFLDDAPAIARCHQIIAELHAGRHGGRAYSTAETVDLARALPGFIQRDAHGPVLVLERA